MAEQDSPETEGNEAAASSNKSGIGRLAGIAAGLFVLMCLSQLTTTIVASRFLPAPGQPAAVAVEEEPEEAPARIDVASLDPPLYSALDQPLIVSFQNEGSVRFLQLTIEAMARDEDSIAAFTDHRPVIKNNLLTLFASLSLDDLGTVAGKEKARDAALAEVQAVLARNAPQARIEDIYFTSFVVQ